MLQLKCQQKYSMGSLYTYSPQLQSTLLSSIPSEIQSKCSIRKIIRSLCNLLKINPLECCLLAWLLAKSRYDVDRIGSEARGEKGEKPDKGDKGIKGKVKIQYKGKDIGKEKEKMAEKSEKGEEEEFEKKMMIFVVMNGYYVKEHVCGQLEPQIQNQVIRQIPNFKYLYNKKFNPQKSLKTLSLSDINKIFNQWTCQQNKKNKIDYNYLVDKILYLSKSYNVSHDDKQQKLGQPRKRRKHNPPSNMSQTQKKSQQKSEMDQKSSNSAPRKQFKYSQQPQYSHSHYNFNLNLNPSQQNHPFKNADAHFDMQQSKRTTRNMLQSMNVYDFIPSPDNLFNSQLSSLSANYGNNAGSGGMMASQNSMREYREQREQRDMMASQSGKDIFDLGPSVVRRSQERVMRGNFGSSLNTSTMRLRRTDSFDQLK